MIVITVPQIYQDFFFRQAGYEKHLKYGHGYTIEISEKMRWHAYVTGNVIKIHADITVNNFHRVARNSYLEKRELKRLLEVKWRIMPESPKTPPDMKMKVGRKGEIAPDVHKLQKRKTKKRNILNPLRYILGPIKVIQ